MTTAEALVLLFLGFWGVVGSVIIAPDSFPYMRLIVVISAFASFLIMGVAFYRHNKPKPYPIVKWVKSAPTRRQQLRQAFFLSVAVSEALSLLSMPILTWQITIVDGVYVITYNNILSIGVFIIGLFVARILVRYTRSSPEEKREFF